MQEEHGYFGHIPFILRLSRQHLPVRICPESIPVLVAGGFVFERGHVHQVGHAAPGQHFPVEHGIEAQLVKDLNFATLVEHVHFVAESFSVGPS